MPKQPWPDRENVHSPRLQKAGAVAGGIFLVVLLLLMVALLFGLVVLVWQAIL